MIVAFMIKLKGESNSFLNLEIMDFNLAPNQLYYQNVVRNAKRNLNKK